MSIDGGMRGKKGSIHVCTREHMHMRARTHSRILFSLQKEGNPAICDSMDEP